MKKITVSLVCDIKDSFMHGYLPGLKKELEEQGHNVRYYKNIAEIEKGEVAFFLACSTILKEKVLSLHDHNVVIHPSKLPEARGSGVVSWKILEGADKIWVTLFKPTDKIDAGEIYYQDCAVLSGDELCDEIREKQAELSFALIKRFLAGYPHLKPVVQEGKSSFYPKRTPKDSELDINKSLKEQFNLLRTVDNERYPAFFYIHGKRYVLKISKERVHA
ncbi:MAG: methionyl-tRNA formyltransferase [Candidatus Omnitrophica bacterium]|nr:methionyl-tRNA formyltransferase [Candidatus Omnitrophota bacterium]MDE2223219.1 methionyl-tRNA formyltransferase [Candidatus Omnitrophota bacterium]